MRGRAGDDLDGAVILEAAECAEDVAVVAFAEVVEPFAEELAPSVGRRGALVLALPGEDLGVVARGLDPRLEPTFEFVLERLAGELLGEDRRDAERDPRAQPPFEEALDPADQREVRSPRRPRSTTRSRAASGHGQRT